MVGHPFDTIKVGSTPRLKFSKFSHCIGRRLFFALHQASPSMESCAAPCNIEETSSVPSLRLMHHSLPLSCLCPSNSQLRAWSSRLMTPDDHAFAQPPSLMPLHSRPPSSLHDWGTPTPLVSHTPSRPRPILASAQVRVQSVSQGSHVTASGAFQSLMKQEGISGLLKGIEAPLIGNIPVQGMSV